MKRKKAVQAGVASNEADINLDPLSEPVGVVVAGPAVEFHVTDNLTGKTSVIQPEQKPKRKYTKRKKANSGATFTPTFIDRAEIKAARLALFAEYIDGIRTFESAKAKDQLLLSLDTMAQQILADRE